MQQHSMARKHQRRKERDSNGVGKSACGVRKSTVVKTLYWAVECKAEVATKDGPKRCGNFLFVSEIPDPRHPHPLGARAFDLTCGVCHQRRSYTEKDVIMASSPTES